MRTGELLAAEKFHPRTNWASGFDLATGYPMVDELKRGGGDHRGESPVRHPVIPCLNARDGRTAPRLLTFVRLALAAPASGSARAK
jgi:hypothetical protein